MGRTRADVPLRALPQDHVRGPHTLEQRLVPGTWHVEVQDAVGHAVKATFVVDDREESEQMLDLPFPAEVRG